METVLAKYLLTLVDVVRDDYGLAAEALYKHASIAPLVPGEEAARVSLQDADALWEAAEAHTQDGLLGLKVGQRVNYLSYASLGHLLLTCSTVGEAIREAAENTAYVGAGGFDLQEDAEGLTLCYRDPNPTRPAAEARVLASLLPFCRFAEWSSGDALPEKVWLIGQPCGNERLKEAFGCIVETGAGQNAVRWSIQVLDLPMQGANAALHTVLAQHVRREIAAHNSFAGKVREFLNGVPPENRTASACADALGLSLRTLQRNLSREETSFRALLLEATIQQAQAMLRRHKHSVGDIAERLGYAEPAPFVRAFKRAVGVSPAEFRRQVNSKQH